METIFKGQRLREQCEMINCRQISMQMTNNIHMNNYA